MYRAVPSWFMDINGQKQDMLAQNQEINWYPEHIKHGRFEKTVLSAPDWNLSRNRFWATPLPVWKGKDANGEIKLKVVGSYEELEKLSGRTLNDYHRPWVDDITFKLDGITYERIPEVIDCWFESGSMPFAQFHYPFENVQHFEERFPADFIVEYVPQVRAWFYVLHAVSVGLFGKSAYKNVMVHGTVAGNDGRKMSKSFGNYTDPNELMDQYSADSLRFLFLSSSLMNGEDFSLVDKDVGDVARKLSMIWNVYDFFTTYAEVDEWEWNGELNDHSEQCENILDTWIISLTHELINDVGKAMKRYDLQSAARFILPFVDDLSNWYVRRSRKRFWKSDEVDDKQMAYKTLHYVLVQLSLVIAPFTPFLAEELYKNLTGKESVHLENWPDVGHVNEQVISEMSALRRAVQEGLAFRSKAQLKVRQPLASVNVEGGEDLGVRKEVYFEVLKEELNVKSVFWETDGQFDVNLDIELTPELISEGHAREVVRLIQQARKNAVLEIDDRIRLNVAADDKIVRQAIENYAEYIKAETLAVTIGNELIDSDYSEEKKLGNSFIKIHITKAN